jgi:pantetheine-phosphate adenylyltransferase
VIGVATNPSKSPLFSLEERIGMVKHETAPLAGAGRATITVQTFDTLLIKFAEQIGASVIVRGLRAVSDFEYEFQMVAMNQRLNAEIETVFLMADPRHQAIASRLVKEIAMLGGNVEAFTTPYIAGLLVNRCEEKRKNA